MRKRDIPPTAARRNAQLRHIIRKGQCVHPEHALVIYLLDPDGFIEWCGDCNTVTCFYEPSPSEREIEKIKKKRAGGGEV